jgi:TRAP-type C4-dicarboxylate transport system permease small subunit
MGVLTQVGRVIGKIVTKTEMMSAVAAGLLLFGMMGLGSANIIGRYVLNSPITGTGELSQVLMACVVALGWACAQADRAHIRVSIVVDSLVPRRARPVVNFLGDLLFAVYSGLIAWRVLPVAIDWWEAGRVTGLIRFPLAIPQFVVFVGACLLALTIITQLVAQLPPFTRREAQGKTEA